MIKPEIRQSFNINHQLVLIYRFLLLLLLFFISRLGFYFFNTEHFADMTLPRFMVILLGGLKFDTAGILLINLFYIFLYHLPFPFRDKKVYKGILKWLFIVSNSIALGANTIDFFYFDFILKRSTADVFMFAGEGNMLTLIGLFLVDFWYGLVFWVLQVFVLIYAYDRLKFTPLIKIKP